MPIAALNHHLLPVKSTGKHNIHLSPPLLPLSIHFNSATQFRHLHIPQSQSSSSSTSSTSPLSSSSSPRIRINPSTRLYISGLSFRTTEESLRNAFDDFGELVEVKLVMDRIANRPRGFAFVRYATEEESKKAIEGMHGKFLDGRVIFVEIAKPRPQLHQDSNRSPM